MPERRRVDAAESIAAGERAERDVGKREQSNERGHEQRQRQCGLFAAVR